MFVSDQSSYTEVMRTLKFRPDEVRRHPLESSPQWMKDVLEYVQHAAEQGEEVEIRSRRVLLTPAQAAERLGISRATVARKIAKGEIAAEKRGSHHRITEAEVRRFHQDRMNAAVSLYADELTAELEG